MKELEQQSYEDVTSVQNDDFNMSHKNFLVKHVKVLIRNNLVRRQICYLDV